MTKKKTRKKPEKTRKKRKKTIPIESDIQRKKEFELFAQWTVLSPLLRFLTGDQLSKIGVDDPTEIELLEIKSQKEFADKFKLNVDTLTNWKKKKEFWDLVDDYQMEWGSRRTPAVLIGFYKKAYSEGDAPRVKLWLQFFKNYREKSEIKHKGAIGVTQEQKVRDNPPLNKAIEAYVEELKKQLKGRGGNEKGDDRKKHPDMDKRKRNSKRKR